MNDVDSVFSDDSLSNSRSHDNKSINLNNDHMAFFKQANKMQNAKPKFQHKNYKKKGPIVEDNAFAAQFAPLAFDNPSDPVSSNNVEHKLGSQSGIAKLEMERELALRGNYSKFGDDSMTYGVVDDKLLGHNNMVPNFKSRTGTGFAYDSKEQTKVNSVNQRKMELFSGSSKSLDYRPKTERRPLFNPIVGAQKWIYGSPSNTEYMKTRFVPSKERRNEKPFQETRVTPGLGKGYNEYSKDGFVDTFRVLPKDVNELRTADKPKVSYGGVIIPGMKGERRGIISNMAKHKPPKFKEQDPRDFVRSLGYYRAPAVYGSVDEDVPITNRVYTTKEWYGPVAFSKDESRPTSMLEQFRTPNKENYLSPTPRNTSGVDKEKATSNTANSYHLEQTRRVTTEVNGYVNPAKTSYSKGYNFDPVNIIPDNTRREATEHMSVLGPAGNRQIGKGVAFDKVNWVPDATQRASTEVNMHIGGAGNRQIEKGYQYDYDLWKPDPTLRSSNEHNTYVGHASNREINQGYQYNAKNWTPDPTKVDENINNTYVGPAGNRQINKGYQYSYNEYVPDPTKKDGNINNTYIGPAGNRQIDKSYQYSYDEFVPDPTKRDGNINNTYIGPMGNRQIDKSYAYSYEEFVPDPTKKNAIENTTYIGNAGNSPLNKPYTYSFNEIVPDPTKKNAIENTTYIGNAGNSPLNKPYTYSYNEIVPDPTKKNAIENTSYIGNAGNSPLNKMYTYSYNEIVPDPTKKNAIENTSYIGNAGNSPLNKMYTYSYKDIVPDPTKKNAIENTTYIGNAGNSPINKAYTYSYKDIVPDPTKKNAIENTTYIGNAGNSPINKAYTYSYKDIVPDPTKKNAIENTIYIGNAGNSPLNKLYTYSYKDIVPDATKRNSSENNGYIGPSNNAQINKSYAYSPQEMRPDPTRRNVYENNTVITGVHGVQMEKGGYQINVQNTYAKPTLRQLNENTTHLNPAVLHEGLKERTREDANESMINVAREMVNTVRDQGEPTTSNYNIGPLYDFTTTQLREEIVPNRDVYGYAGWKNPLQCVPTAYTRSPSDIPNQDFRLDNCILSGLDTNVYINNTQHKYVEY